MILKRSGNLDNILQQWRRGGPEHFVGYPSQFPFGHPLLMRDDEFIDLLEFFKDF